jgi:hypothetical protein
MRLAGGQIVASSPISRDCVVLSYLPNWDHGEVDWTGIGNYDGGYRTLIEWQPVDRKLATTPDNRFALALYARKSTSSVPPGPLLAFTLTEEWAERTSWGNQPACDLEPAASFKFEPGEGWKLFDITPIIRSQAKSAQKGHGLIMRFLHEDRSSRGAKKSEYNFVSREGAGEYKSRRPVLLVVKTHQAS